MSAYETAARVEEGPRPSYGERPKATKVPAELLGLLDTPLVVHRCFIPVAGSIAGALFLSQALYWSTKGRSGDGWFYKTQEEWTAEIGINRYELDQVRKALKEKGILQEKLKGVPPKVHYHLDLERLAECVREGSPANQFVEGQQIDLSTLSKSTRSGSANLSSTEITTETTASPPTPQGGGAGGAESTSGSRGPNRFFAALEEHYLVRTVRGDEWLQIQEQLDRWSKKNYRISFAWFKEACIDARAACKADTGKFPRTVVPLINHLAELIGDMEPQRV